MDDNTTKLSYWFPTLEAAGLPVPKTIIVRGTKDEVRALDESLEEPTTRAGAMPLIERIKDAVRQIGTPCFLRNDLFSGKHDWENCCFVKSVDDVEKHVRNIDEFWAFVSWGAGHSDAWIVREFLPTTPIGVCERYGNMPICREFRFFINGGDIECWHPYWPENSLTDGGARFYNGKPLSFDNPSAEELAHISELASKAGKVLGGRWSVDLLETKDGWYITDLADAVRSWHWPECPNAPKPPERNENVANLTVAVVPCLFEETG